MEYLVRILAVVPLPEAVVGEDLVAVNQAVAVQAMDNVSYAGGKRKNN